jgi:hypothetical protein
LETEVSVRKIDHIHELLKDYRSCIILYTYDSLLFDITIEEAKQLIPAIKEIMESGKLPVKCKLGGIYSKMNEFVL